MKFDKIKNNILKKKAPPPQVQNLVLAQKGQIKTRETLYHLTQKNLSNSIDAIYPIIIVEEKLPIFKIANIVVVLFLLC